MDFEIITIFPDLIEAVAPYGVVGRAGEWAPAPLATSSVPAGGAGSAQPQALQAQDLQAPVQAQQDQVEAQVHTRTLRDQARVQAQTRPIIPENSRRNDAPRYRLRCWNPRDFTHDNYRRVDDRPYGGGPGMVMLAEPLLRCVQAIRRTREAEGRPPLPLIHLSPQGQPLRQARARALAASPGAILLCGRYEAIDQRFLDAEVDEEISIGDFVVSGGELPAMLLLDAVVRLLPGVLNHDESATRDSFEDGLLDCPHYTRPEHLPGLPAGVPADVPAVLLSGNHREIDRWRRERSLQATAAKRPDLLPGGTDGAAGAGVDGSRTAPPTAGCKRAR